MVFVYFSKRAAAPAALEVLSADARAPVLYLRAFNQEKQAFTTVSGAQLSDMGIPNRLPLAARHYVTLEEYFAAAVCRNAGPFIALGNPHDVVSPGGASRDYIDDQTWHDRFWHLSERSLFIVMGPETSGNLQWELSSIRAAGLQTKLFVLTTPPTCSLVERLCWGMGRGQRVWPAFATAAAACGLHVGAYPGRGATITFTQDGNRVVVGENAKHPEDYLRAVLEHQESLLLDIAD